MAVCSGVVCKIQATPHKDCAADSQSFFSSGETKSGVHTLCIHEHFCEIWRKKRKQMACKAVRRVVLPTDRGDVFGWNQYSLH